MINRRGLLTMMLAVPASSTAAQTRRPRIGWLVFGGTTLGAIDKTLQDALAQRGFVDGRTIDVTFRYANGISTRLAALAKELVAQSPDLLLAVGGDVVKAIFNASKGSIPIVGGVSDNPIRGEIATTLARPGKNFTGITFITDEMAAKRMELLKEVAPDTKRVVVIWNPQHLDDEMLFARRSAETLGIGIIPHPVNSIGDVDAALRDIGASGADSLFVIPSRLTNLAAVRIAQYGRGQRLPVIAAWREFTDSGCLLSYGPSRAFEAGRLAGYVEKILGGARPADIPIEQPTKFELVVNLRTAKEIGLTVPTATLLRADEVIE
jgi:putative ABC transport system substrate-binding protein